MKAVFELTRYSSAMIPEALWSVSGRPVSLWMLKSNRS